MRRIFSLMLVVLLLSVGVAGAVSNYESDNVVIVGPFGGAQGITPATQIMKVRYGSRIADAPSLASGDVVIWDTTSADGYTITACVTDADAKFAGVLVTTIATADSSSVTATRNVGYMATSGYCLAKVDTSVSHTGQRLVMNGGTQHASFGTTGGSASAVGISYDIGVLLIDNAADGLMPVVLD